MAMRHYDTKEELLADVAKSLSYRIDKTPPARGATVSETLASSERDVVAREKARNRLKTILTNVRKRRDQRAEKGVVL